MPCIKTIKSYNKYHIAKYIRCWVVSYSKAATVMEATQLLKLKHKTVKTLRLKLFYTVHKNTVRTA